MKLTLDRNHPLAQAITSIPVRRKGGVYRITMSLDTYGRKGTDHKRVLSLELVKWELTVTGGRHSKEGPTETVEIEFRDHQDYKRLLIS